jgi:hypothetical protein
MSLFDEDSRSDGAPQTDAEKAEASLVHLATLASQWAWKSVLDELGNWGAVGPDIERRQLKFGVMAGFFREASGRAVASLGRDVCNEFIAKLLANPTSGALAQIYARLIAADFALRADSRATGEWSDPFDDAIDAAKAYAIQTGQRDEQRANIVATLLELRQTCYEAQARNRTLAPFFESSTFCQAAWLRRFLELPSTWSPDPAFAPTLEAPHPSTTDAPNAPLPPVAFEIPVADLAAFLDGREAGNQAPALEQPPLAKTESVRELSQWRRVFVLACSAILPVVMSASGCVALLHPQSGSTFAWDDSKTLRTFAPLFVACGLVGLLLAMRLLRRRVATVSVVQTTPTMVGADAIVMKCPLCGSDSVPTGKRTTSEDGRHFREMRCEGARHQFNAWTPEFE